jgi:cell division protein FtsI (penicillin-binding protein 3)
MNRATSRAVVQTPGVSKAARVRARTAAALVSALILGVGYKAWGLQVESSEKFREQALRQHVHTVEIPAPRGAILDARGRPLAISADAESVWADPRAVVDVAGSAERVAAALGLEVNVVEARLASRKRFAWIARHVTPEQAKAVRALKLAGIEVAHEPRRWYPERSTGGTVIGFAGLDGNGLDGLELQMDAVLTGQKARFAAIRDARGKTMMSDGLTEAVPGATVQLTLDATIQHIADEALAAAVTENKAKGGTAVVLDVATGGVLAMSSLPTYDPNDPAKAVQARARNRAVTDSYEIGSIMKIFNVSLALDAGVTRPDELWNVENGRWAIPGKTITDVHGASVLTTTGIIKRSSNVGAAKIGMRLGRDRLYAGLKRFGFGTPTGIELPGEQAGKIRNGATWRDIELATISYGYGLTVTPIQVAAGLAAVGNGGVYHEPRLIERVTSADGTLLYQRRDDGRAVIKPVTAAQMRAMLAAVFEKATKGEHDGGTAAGIDVPGFHAGGKTATAHKWDPAIKTYALRRYLSSFAGLVPIAAPRLAIVVVIDEPDPARHFGGQVAGPVFGAIASQSLRYLGVPGDAAIESRARRPPSPTSAAPASRARWRWPPSAASRSRCAARAAASRSRSRPARRRWAPPSPSSSAMRARCSSDCHPGRNRAPSAFFKAR